MTEGRDCWAAEMAEHLRSESRLLCQQAEELVAGTSRAATPDCSLPGTPRAAPAPPPVPERIYVYAPRENKCSRFSGERLNSTASAEDWVKEARKALVGQPLTPAEQVTWVCDLLDGEAKREVTFSLDLEQVHVNDVFAVLIEHFGCDQPYVALQRQFFQRQQGKTESLREFAQVLMTLLQQLQQKDARIVPLPDLVLRDAFVENLHNIKLQQELMQVIRTHPNQTFREIRDIALRWERRQLALGATRAPTPSPSDQTPATSRTVTTDAHIAPQTCSEFQEFRETLKRQQAQLDTILQKLNTSASAPWGAPPPLLPRPPRQRPLPFQPDGTPICLRCGEPGHMIRRCPRMQVNSRPATAADSPPAPVPRPAENSHPTSH